MAVITCEVFGSDEHQDQHTYGPAETLYQAARLLGVKRTMTANESGIKTTIKPTLAQLPALLLSLDESEVALELSGAYIFTPQITGESKIAAGFHTLFQKMYTLDG